MSRGNTLLPQVFGMTFTTFTMFCKHCKLSSATMNRVAVIYKTVNKTERR